MYTKLIQVTCVLWMLGMGAGRAWAQGADDHAGARSTDQQAAGTSGADQEGVLQVFRLQNANADEVADIVRSITPRCRVGVDRRTGSLAISGDGRDVKRAIELAMQLDVSADADALETAVFRVRRLPNRRLLNAVISERAQVEVDDDTNLVVVHGTEGDIKQVHSVIESLLQAPEGPAGDQPVGMQLSFYFLQSRSQPDEGESAGTPLPESLRPVAKALEAHGFQNTSLLATLLVHAEPDNDFQVEGKVFGGSDFLDVAVRGTAISSDDPHAVSLELAGTLSRTVRLKEGMTSRDHLFEVSTQLETRFDQYVVLAASPSSSGQVQAVALVVHAKPTG